MRIALALALATSSMAAERRIPESEVRDLLHQAAEQALGPDVQIDAIHYRGDLVVRGDGLAAEVDPPAGRPSGRTALRATLRTSEEERPISFLVEIRAPEPAVRHGASVLLLARSGAVTVSAAGEAQQDGAVGDKIHVLCSALHRILVGRVLDSATVQIDLGAP
jgi:flagellar basal body P-ring formation chaperone FlgA